MSNCKTCNGDRYVHPEGQPEFSEPCWICNQGGVHPFAPSSSRDGTKVKTPSDKDPFPFGKYKDEKYGDIRASYFLWLGDQIWIKTWPHVAAYIEEHRESLEEESFGGGC